MNRHTNTISLFDALESRIDRLITEASNPSIPTGFKVVDDLCGGLHNSQVILLAARPSVGKTAFMLDVAMNISKGLSIPTAIISPVLSAEHLSSSILIKHCGIDVWKFNSPTALQMDELKSITEEAAKLRDVPLYIDDTPQISLDDFIGLATQLAIEQEVRVIFIDYMQQIDVPFSAGKADKNKLLIQAFRDLADKFGIAIVVLSQINRPIKPRKPSFKDLEQTGFRYESLNENVDIAAVLYRPDWCGKGDGSNSAEILVVHNKHGRRDLSLELRFNPDRYSFSDIQNDCHKIKL